MVENKIKLGIVSNTNIERNSEFKKVLKSPFIDYFEITSKDLNGNLDEFVLPPTSLVTTDKGLKNLEELIKCVANNVASSNFTMGLKSFTIDIMKYTTILPSYSDEWDKFLQDLSVAIQTLVIDQTEITIYLKGFESFVGSAKHSEFYLRKFNEEISAYDEDDDTKVIFKPALVIGRGDVLDPNDIAKSGTVYLSPTKIGKDFSYKEPLVRAWAVALLKAQRIAEESITIYYEDDISSIASIANLVQIFKPELIDEVKGLELTGNIDRLRK